MSHVTDHIITALKAARENKAISQRELSAKAGVPANTTVLWLFAAAG